MLNVFIAMWAMLMIISIVHYISSLEIREGSSAFKPYEGVYLMIILNKNITLYFISLVNKRITLFEIDLKAKSLTILNIVIQWKIFYKKC